MIARWHIRWALLALFALTYGGFAAVLAEIPAEVPADDPNHPSGLPTYRSNASEVRVTFFATDADNHPVATLTKSDFAVIDAELVVRNFRSFAHSTETSLDVVALVDLSDSVVPRFRAEMSDVLQLVALEQAIPNDSIAVISFAGAHPAILCSDGCRASGSAARLLAVKSDGTTPLFDALVLGADFIAHHRRAGARPVLILFSDGNDTISLHSAHDALEAVLAGGALVYSVDIGTSPRRSSGSMFLREVSDITGGRYFFFSRSHSRRLSQQGGAATVLNAVLEDLRASYVVTYEVPNHDAGFHALSLMPTHNLNLTFHSRSGYYYEPGVH